MRGQRKWFWLLFGVGFLLSVSGAEASVIINEIFADPPSGLIGDANLDGVRSSSGDEFVEILNLGASEVDISNWFLTDNVSTRHVFPSGTVINPYTFFVVFGGGDPMFPGNHWQTASSGSLGLNNSGDTVSIFNSESQLIDQVVYGSIGGQDQSINLSPDGVGLEFFLHSTLEQAQGTLFSPGTSIDARLSLAVVTQEEEIPKNPTVPELPTLIYFMSGWGSIMLKRYM